MQIYLQRPRAIGGVFVLKEFHLLEYPDDGVWLHEGYSMQSFEI